MSASFRFILVLTLFLSVLLTACGQEQVNNDQQQQAVATKPTPIPATIASVVPPVTSSTTGTGTDAPFEVKVTGTGPIGADDRAIEMESSTFIVQGVITKVMAARWSTSDGKRPANPFAEPRYTIYRPVVLQVNQYLRGQQTQTELWMEANGGTIGRDKVEWYGNGTYDFHSGEKVIMFLSLRPTALVFDDHPLYAINAHYTIGSDGIAKSSRGDSLPATQLSDEIAKANKS